MRGRHFAAFVAPSVLVMGGLLLIPLAYTVVWSFQDISYGSPGRWIGLRNFTATLGTSRFQAAVGFTIAFTAVVTVLLIVVGYVLALLLDSTSRRMRTMFLGLIMVSYVVPLVVGGLAFAQLFDPTYGGPVANLLAYFGWDVQWLTSTWPARTVVVLNTVWSQAAFATLIVLAGLNTVDSAQVEAAVVDGAGKWDVQRYVVIPRLQRLFALIALICVMDSLRVFDQIQVITPSSQNVGTESIMGYTYDVALGTSQRLGLASAISVMTMLITFVVLLPFLRSTYRDVTAR